MSWLTGEWSTAFLVQEVAEGQRWWEHCDGARGGVYRLVALLDRQPFAVPRFGGVDSSGTLYIGQAQRLDGRIGSLVSTHHPDYLSGSHPRLSEELVGRLGLQLAVAWHYCENPRERERELIGSYRSAFGEKPPLNSQS